MLHQHNILYMFLLNFHLIYLVWNDFIIYLLNNVVNNFVV